jgi:Ca2+-transporting ATPase
MGFVTSINRLDVPFLGLPLAVTLALAFATRRMTQMNLLVRVLSSCEIMANATVVCTDKTGTLTQNKMTIVAGSIGVHCKFAADLEQNERRVNIDEKDTDELQSDSITSPQEGNPQISVTDDPDSPSTQSATQTCHPNLRLDFSVDQAKIQQHLTPALIQLFNESIAINSTAFEAKVEGGRLEFIGSKTETALLSFAKEQGWPDYHQVRQNRAEIVQMIPFSSQRKAMGVVVRLPESGRYRLFIKGASEVLTKLTSHYVCVRGPSAEQGTELDPDTVTSAPFDLDTRENVSRTIMFYANQSLRTIALCYRDFESWPPNMLAPGTDTQRPNSPNGEVSFEKLIDGPGLTLLAVVAIEDPLRPGVTEAVANCARAGVAVKMVTGDNIITAKSALYIDYIALRKFAFSHFLFFFFRTPASVLST